jgi:hypothetical protein
MYTSREETKESGYELKFDRGARENGWERHP